MSLTIDHALFASALQVSLDPSSSVPMSSKSVDQKPAHPKSQIVDCEKTDLSDLHQTSDLRVTGVRFIVLFSG